MKPYSEFLASKLSFDRSVGFDIDPGELNPILKTYQAKDA